MITFWDFHAATTVASVSNALANRRQPSVTGVESTEDIKRKITGIMLRTTNTGYLEFIRNAASILTADMAVLNAQTDMLDVDIECPIGKDVSPFTVNDAAQVAAVDLILRVEETGG